MAPFYYRFILHPSNGEVELAHNEEDHPAHVRYHSDLATGESGLYHGYAYRIKGGWRLTDWDHRSIDDPFVIAQVIREIRKQEGAYLPHDELSWEEQGDPAFDKFHYGLPVS